MTHAECARRAKAAYMTVFAIQYGGECRGGEGDRGRGWPAQGLNLPALCRVRLQFLHAVNCGPVSHMQFCPLACSGTLTVCMLSRIIANPPHTVLITSPIPCLFCPHNTTRQHPNTLR